MEINFSSSSSVLSETELLLQNGRWVLSNFPPIPISVRSHCVVQLSPTEIMIIGGNLAVEDGHETQKTFVLNQSLTWIEGPPLSKPRQGVLFKMNEQLNCQICHTLIFPCWR